MSDYDNTNSGAAFPPLPDQAMILTGKIDIEGQNKGIVLVKDTDRNGQDIIAVYSRMGTLYRNEDATDENRQPAYRGPADGNKRFAAWKRQSEKGGFLSIKIEDARPRQDAAPAPNTGAAPDDNIPF